MRQFKATLRNRTHYTIMAESLHHAHRELERMCMDVLFVGDPEHQLMLYDTPVGVETIVLPGSSVYHGSCHSCAYKGKEYKGNCADCMFRDQDWSRPDRSVLVHEPNTFYV